jgi:hypothetical protein
VDIDAKVTMINADARAKAQAFSPIFFGLVTAFANARVEVDSTVQSLILGNLGGPSTEIRGTRGVDVQARHLIFPPNNSLGISRDADALAVALIPPQGEFAEGDTNLHARVDADAGAVFYVAALGGEGDSPRTGFDLALVEPDSTESEVKAKDR